jgi:hypothetical protein
MAVLVLVLCAVLCAVRGGVVQVRRPDFFVLIPIIQNEPTVDPNCVLGQPLRPARKRPGSRSRGAYEARGATRNFRTEVGSRLSSTRRHPVARRSAAERPMGGFWPRIYVIKKGHARDIYFLLQTRNF